jgi:hypothetical protein
MLLTLGAGAIAAGKGRAPEIRENHTAGIVIA